MLDRYKIKAGDLVYVQCLCALRHTADVSQNKHSNFQNLTNVYFGDPSDQRTAYTVCVVIDHSYKDDMFQNTFTVVLNDGSVAIIPESSYYERLLIPVKHVPKLVYLFQLSKEISVLSFKLMKDIYERLNQ